MIDNISIQNFRSIKNQSFNLKKLNILYGPNGSGKSSCMYAPHVMKNFFVNPNQKMNSLFNLGFINLGGIENIINNSVTNKGFEITISSKNNENAIDYELMVDPDFFLGNGSIVFKLNKKEYPISFDFPYTLSDKIQIEIGQSKILWNGLTFETMDSLYDGVIAVRLFNQVFEYIKSLEVISVKRGFFSPIFSTEQATDESLFAMQIRDEGPSFESKIDHYFKKLFNKTFRFVAIPGSTSFYLKTQNSKGFTTDLVNEGFGVNQALYMLIKLLKKSTSLAFIEEPEIHLHPSAQAKLVDVFTEIIQKENKQLFITTHSETIVATVLRKIAEGELDKNDVQFYLAKFEDDETKIIPQDVNDKGQIEGGLMSFMEAEMDYLKTLLGI